MGTSRVLGALLCVACIVVAIAEIYYGIIDPIFLAPVRHIPLAILLPVVIGVLVVVGLGFWLGWIMATTKEVSPAAPVTPPTPPPTPSEEPVKKEEEAKAAEETSPAESKEEAG